MRITLLGTSASNAYPEPFCSCENCARTWELGGRSMRRRCSALIDDDLLIDLGPDIMTASHAFALPLTNLRYVLQTHPHADHIDAAHLNSRSPDFGVVGAPRMLWCMTEPTCALIRRTMLRDLTEHDILTDEGCDGLNLDLQIIEPGRPFELGDYRVFPFPANHAHGKGAVLYGIERDTSSGEHAVFYGTDTGPFEEETWQMIEESGMTFDVVLLDHTNGTADGGSATHMGVGDVREHVRRMREHGILKPEGRVIATHIAHDTNPPHPELEEIGRANGYEIGYDGMTINTEHQP